MKSVTIAAFKRHLPELLDEVAKGNQIVLQKGQKRKNVAILGPYSEQALRPRQLGILAHRGVPEFHDWEMTDDQFLANR